MSANKFNKKQICFLFYPEFLLTIFVIFLFFMMYKLPLSVDVTYQLWAARQILNGSKLYVDVIETNPPLWFWMALPVEYVARKFDFNLSYTLITFIFIYATSSLYLISFIIKDFSSKKRSILLLSIASIMLLTSLRDIGQREHLALIGVFPYMILIARRSEGVKIAPWIAVLTAIIASPAFAFKHYFIITPIFFEIFLFVQLRKKWTLFRSENFVFIVLAAAYPVSIFIITPEFFTNLSVFYSFYALSKINFHDFFNESDVHIWIVSFFIMLFYKKEAKDSLLAASAIAALGFAASYFWQQKGFVYHALPATGLTCFMIISLLNAHQAGSLTFIQRAICILAACFPFYLSLVKTGPYKSPASEVIKAVIPMTPGGTSVFAFSIEASVIWPDVINSGYKWPSRHVFLWMWGVKNIVNRNSDQFPGIEKYSNEVFDQVVTDLSCNPPGVILIDEYVKNYFLEDFLKDKRFNDFFAHYSLYKKLNDRDIYRNEVEFYYKDNVLMPEKNEKCPVLNESVNRSD